MDAQLEAALTKRLDDVTPQQALEIAQTVLEALETFVEDTEPYAKHTIAVLREARTIVVGFQE